jgi:hypothetical protein
LLRVRWIKIFLWKEAKPGKKHAELRGNKYALENAMGLENLIPEEHIRHRAYCIWEADGHQEGRCHDYWQRAKAELEEELVKAHDVPVAEEADVEFVMPRPPISKPVCRSESARIDPDWFREAA